jgi:hypothetical protein
VINKKSLIYYYLKEMGLEKPTSFRDKLSIIVDCKVSNKKRFIIWVKKEERVEGVWSNLP